MNDMHPTVISCNDDTIVRADPGAHAVDRGAVDRTSTGNVYGDLLDVIAITAVFETCAQTIDFPIEMPFHAEGRIDVRSPSRYSQADKRNLAIA